MDQRSPAGPSSNLYLALCCFLPIIFNIFIPEDQAATKRRTFGLLLLCVIVVVQEFLQAEENVPVTEVLKAQCARQSSIEW